MYNYFIDRALNDVNCSQYQDKQFIIKAPHINRPSGSKNYVEVLHKNIKLPEGNKFYHLYQAGRLHPLKIGLLTRKISWVTEKWYSFKEAINSNDLIVNLYTTEGLEIPKFDSYYMFTSEGDLLLALYYNRKLDVDYLNDIYMRVYSNAYFDSPRSHIGNELTYTNGRYIITNQDVLDIQSEITNYINLDGYVTQLVNGIKVKEISLLTAKVGDVVEYIYDSSIKNVVRLRISDLKIFTSILDNKLKYLYHYPDLTPGNTDNDIIEYYDDTDVHILYYSGPLGAYKGLYYHRNSKDAMRMVTHRDYSLPVDYITYTSTKLNQKYFNNNAIMNDMIVEIKIRDSGFQRKLIYDSNIIFELYKLDNDKLLDAMIGTNSVLDIWRAENLENSAYCKLMQVYSNEITSKLVEDAYGYNGLSKIGGDTPTAVIQVMGNGEARLPYLLRENSTIYEYDADGILIGVSYHDAGSTYFTTNSSIKTIEVVYGRGTDNPLVLFGTDNIPLPTNNYYRVYRSFLNNGVSDGVWEDITSSDLYNVINNTLIWNNLEFNYILMIRSDRDFPVQNLSIPLVEGNLFFTLAELEDRGSGIQKYELPIPLGQLDIWLNGRSLIKDLDYKVVFPKVYIINKKYLNQPAGTSLQDIKVRYLGFPDSNLQSDPDEDKGFIEYGYLSNNNKHDIRDDKVLRITVDGKLKTKDQVIFSEQHSGVSILNSDNGLPYQIKDIIVPLQNLVPTDYYTLKEQAKLIDSQVSDYMSFYLPEPPRSGPNIISSRYPIVSPFFATIIEHLRVDIITESTISNIKNDNDVLNLLNNYEELLAFDPITVSNQLNPLYTIIHPTMLNNSISLSIVKYQFLEKVVKLYGRGLIDLTNFITVTT